jgi:hypothetical protein
MRCRNTSVETVARRPDLLVDTLNEQFRLHTDVCNMLGCLSRLHYDNGQSNLC